ncbi:MAG: DUF1266 domain-containing protein [Oscillospiraceae bacterium]|nr:DUF1266 domain-containing protein [Oscillospiraceae bacterium]
MKHKKTTSFIMASLLMLTALLAPAASAAETPSTWAVEAVENAVSIGLVPPQLQSDYTAATTRAEFCALAVLLYENVTGAEIRGRTKFSDTEDVNVEKAAAIEVVNGIGGGRFDPDATLTREQAATMLARLSKAAGMPLPEQAPTFEDADTAHEWAMAAIGQMQASGIMQGTTSTRFSPLGIYERQQSIATIHRLYKVVIPDIDPYYKAWALGCSAILATRNTGNDPYEFGMFAKTTSNAATERALLRRDWSINNRDELLETIDIMTDYGHNIDFAISYEIISSLTPEEYDAVLVLSSGMDKYMFPLTKSLGEKWGDTQIKAWDWFRMVHLAVWGYIAGYLDLEETYECMQPLIDRLLSTFSSWEEACENYMDGYAWWSRTDVSQSNTEYLRRLEIYESIKDDLTLFDPTLWE